MPNAIAQGLSALSKTAKGKGLTEKQISAYNDMINGIFRKEEEARDTIRKMELLGLISIGRK